MDHEHGMHLSKTASPPVKKPKVIVYGSSHVTERHHLPEKLDSLARDANFNRFETPFIYKGKGGRLFNHSALQDLFEIINNFKKQQMKLVLVLILGGNNLRKTYRQSGEKKMSQEIDFLVQMYENLVDKISNSDGCHLIVVSPLPSPATQEIEYCFEQLNVRLKKMIARKRSPEKVTYLNCRCRLSNSKKPLDVRRQGDPTMYSDGIHLNEIGAGWLSKELFTSLQHIPKAIFEVEHTSKDQEFLHHNSVGSQQQFNFTMNENYPGHNFPPQKTMTFYHKNNLLFSRQRSATSGPHHCYDQKRLHNENYNLKFQHDDLRNHLINKKQKKEC